MATDSYPLSHGSLAGLSGTDHHTQYGIWFSGPATTRPTAPYRFGRWYYANDTSQVSLDTGAAWLDMASKAYVDSQVAGFAIPAKTIRIPHTFTISGPVGVLTGDTNYLPPFFVPVPTGQTVKFVGTRYRINSGTSATVQVNRNGALMWGGGTVTTTTTGDTQNITLTNNDVIQFIVTAISGAPQNLSFTIYFDYTV